MHHVELNKKMTFPEYFEFEREMIATFGERNVTKLNNKTTKNWKIVVRNMFGRPFDDKEAIKVTGVAFRKECDIITFRLKFC